RQAARVGIARDLGGATICRFGYECGDVGAPARPMPERQLGEREGAGVLALGPAREAGAEGQAREPGRPGRRGCRAEERLRTPPEGNRRRFLVRETREAAAGGEPE